MHRMLRSRGKFYYAVPIGPLRVEFNAHRVFSLRHLLDLFQHEYTVDSFSYVNDKGQFFRDGVLSDQNIRDNFGCIYGCGIFQMTKR